MLIPIEYVNALMFALQVAVPILLWTVANWGFTTLMNGKGKLFDIYVATVYAFTPTIIMNASGIIISQFITYQEGTLYAALQTIALIWTVMLVLVAMMQIHDYTMKKAFFCSILSIAGIGFILFVFLLFFSLISDAVVYFVGIVNEIVFRLY